MRMPLETWSLADSETLRTNLKLNSPEHSNAASADAHDRPLMKGLDGRRSRWQPDTLCKVTRAVQDRRKGRPNLPRYMISSMVMAGKRPGPKGRPASPASSPFPAHDPHAVTEDTREIQRPLRRNTYLSQHSANAQLPTLRLISCRRLLHLPAAQPHVSTLFGIPQAPRPGQVGRPARPRRGTFPSQRPRRCRNEAGSLGAVRRRWMAIASERGEPSDPHMHAPRAVVSINFAKQTLGGQGRLIGVAYTTGYRSRERKRAKRRCTAGPRSGSAASPVSLGGGNVKEA